MDTLVNKGCPNCGAESKDTHYVSPDSECYEMEGDVDCLACGYGWNDLTEEVEPDDPDHPYPEGA